MFRTKAVLLVFLLSIDGVGGAERAAASDAADWMIGLARVKITPQEPVRMSGYGARTEPSQGVAWDLYAKAMALQDGEGNRAVLVTTDLIGFRASFAEPLCQRIEKETGLKRHQILLNSSHTHTGPTIALDDDDLDFPEEQAQATVRYSRRLQDGLVELVKKSLDGLEPAKLSRGTGLARFVMNRREFTERGVRLGVNPRGHVDRSVPVLRIDSLDGRLRGVLFGTACHNTTLTGRHLQISGDYAGYAQARIEEEHPGTLAMFVQNCGGDANPYPRGSEAIARQHGRELGEEVLRVLKGELGPVGGPLTTLLEPVELPLQADLTRDKIEQLAEGRGGWRSFVSGRMLEILDRGRELPESYTAPVALWQFGDDLTLVGLPGEVVVDYVRMIEDALGPRRLWVSAYSNDVFGYLPSARVLAQGGYETRGLYAGGIGLFSPKAEDVLVSKLREMSQRAGRRTRK